MSHIYDQIVEAIREHGVDLSDFPPPSRMDQDVWLETHFPTGEWGTSYVHEAPRIIREFPRDKVVK